MNGLKKIFCLFSGQFRSSIVSARVWLGYAMGIILALKTAYNYSGYAYERVIQIFEPYIENFVSIGNMTLMLIGYILIISDAPFINRRSTLALYRTSRGQWFWGMTLYVAVHGILYYTVCGLASCIFVAGKGYVDNLWSMPMWNFARVPSMEAVERWQLTPVEEIMLDQYTPAEAVFHTILMIFMYSFILALLLLIFNTVWNQAVGAVLAAAVHIIGYAMVYSGFSGIMSQWSLLGNSTFSSLADSGTPLLRSYLLLLLVICVLLFSGSPLIKRADFNLRTGEKDE